MNPTQTKKAEGTSKTIIATIGITTGMTASALPYLSDAAAYTQLSFG